MSDWLRAEKEIMAEVKAEQKAVQKEVPKPPRKKRKGV
jgi:hypothetical protein